MARILLYMAVRYEGDDGFNDRIHPQWQGNRNPFIDHPEWADAIWN